jgi:hypothetical protein
LIAYISTAAKSIRKVAYKRTVNESLKKDEPPFDNEFQVGGGFIPIL